MTRGGSLGWPFAKLWAASTTSSLGSGLSMIAAPLFAAARTHSAFVISLTSVASWLPWLLFALPGGVLVDRVDRRRLMVAIDWARVGAVGVLTAALLAGWTSIALLDVVLFIVNAGEVVFRSASRAMIPAVVERESLERANGWLIGGAILTEGLLAGPLGSFLFGVAVSLPFLVNTGTYAVSAMLIGLVAGSYRAAPASGPASGERKVRHELAEGFRWLIGQRVLRTMTFLIGLLNVTLIAATAVLVLLARERLGLGPFGFGVLMGCEALGAVLGSAFGDRIVARFTATWTIRIGLLIEAGLHLTLATTRSALVAGLMLFAFGIHAALWTMVANSLQQRLTPPQLLGRVGSTTLFVSAGGNCLGAVLGGAVASSFGITAPYWIGFVTAIAVSAVTWRVFTRQAVAEAYAGPVPSADDVYRDAVEGV